VAGLTLTGSLMTGARTISARLSLAPGFGTPSAPVTSAAKAVDARMKLPSMRVDARAVQDRSRVRRPCSEIASLDSAVPRRSILAPQLTDIYPKFIWLKRTLARDSLTSLDIFGDCCI